MTEGADRDTLVTLLGAHRDQRGAEQIRWIRERMDEHGSLEYAEQIANGLAGAAQAECETILAGRPASRDKELIEGLVHWALGRSR